MLFQTVAALNYLPRVLVLAKTLKAHMPRARLCVLITDVTASTLGKINDQFGQHAEFLACDVIGDMTQLRRYYSILEFNSACKILALGYQLRTRAEQECCFIDPDMMVMGELAEALRSENRDVLLTHHTRRPYPRDGEAPTEMELATAGYVNGGLIYMRGSPRALAALGWLNEHVHHNWFVAPAFGLYADQRWLDFLPQFFEDATGILSDPGVNIAYWNLHERPLRMEGGLLLAGGRPATLFHFSGFTDGSRLSQHSNRRFDAETELCLRKIVEMYKTELEAARVRVANSAVTADLTFCWLPLHRRMKLAGKLHEHEFVELAHPTGYFARQGGLVDKLIRRLRTAHAGGDGARAAANQGG